ncbi:phage head morphogenesis protein [Nitratireductor sp. B36]|uniref:phage minor head protein n=1 Tax=Nitratireductor sp. B36 TaxID=2762059 RepID=UPI001E311383|nr:phage minor head protein [Nitratireductor sp. B36]MCC5777861.1 phage head morphogenesis protein [Nitratireductor sp. B36]
MKINLAAQARAAGVKADRITMQAIEPTTAQEKDLARLYVAIVRVWANGAKERILPAYSRSLAEQRASDGLTIDRAGDVEVEIEAVESEAVRSIFTFRGLFQAWADTLQRWHMSKVISQLSYATNVDLSTQMHAGDVQETMEDVVARNVALVRNVSDQTRGRIADIVFRGLQSRTPAREVAKEINAALQLGRKRSLRIAMDQTQKLSASLDRDRQLQLGMKKFEWVHSGKIHYRPEHLARNGKVIPWNSEIGKKDPPGFQPFCGCKAKGVLEL